MAGPSQTKLSVDDGNFDATPEGSAKRWQAEFKAAREALKEWHASAEECDRKYRDDQPREVRRLNLYAAGVDLKEATLYGNSPNADVERRDDDQDDDVARVAAELLERVLNNDLERTEEGAPAAYGLALKDWLVPGMGNVWHRLDRETQDVAEQPARMAGDGVTELAPAVPATTQTANEEVSTEYKFWKDQLWSPCRVFPDCRWFAYRALLSKKTIEKKFGDEAVPLSIGADPKDKTVPRTPWARAEVWEIWDKENRCVYWYVEDHPRVLVPVELQEQANPDGSLPDPLEISGFWPFPEPLFEGLTNSKLVPRPSYARAQDLYTAVDDETTRIGLLRDAIDASCVYDKTVGELAGLLDSKGENRAVPAANYKALAEKGGIAACVSWKPLEAIVAALTQLRDLRREDIDLLFQVDGTSDIMRGQATESGATATEQAIKAKYGSIRGGKAQKRFASFVADAQRIRGEIICKHFDPQTIAQRANAQGLPQQDQLLVEQAIALLKSDFARFRISVKSESVSLTDYAANKQEALDVVGMIGGFFQAVQPLVAGAPQLGPAMLQLLTVFIARVKGGDAAEPILDQMVKQVQMMAQQAAAQPPPPNPKLQAEQVKGQTEQVKAGAEQFRAKADVVKTQLEMRQAAAEHSQSMQQLEAETRAEALKTALAPGAGAA